MKLTKPSIPGKKGKGEKPAANAGKAAKAERTSRGGKFILLLGDEGAILTYVQGGKVTRRLFAPSPQQEHVSTLVELMSTHPNSPIYLLVDMIDQSYVRHTLPPVSPLSVNKLVTRRLERDFAPEDITGALNLGREKTGRKEWNFLLISLANSALLQQWMDVLLDLPNHFKGLHLVPVEGQNYIADLSKSLNAKDAEPAQWQILVSHDKVGGFRQIVLRDGRLIFTRLTQSMGDAMPEVIAGGVEQEVQNTVEYLKRLSFDDRNGLEIFVIVSQEIRDAIDSNKLKATRSFLLTPYDVSQALKQEQSALSGDRFGDVVMAAAFGRSRKPALKLMTKQAKKIETFYQAKWGVRGFAALICAGIFYMMVNNVLGVLSANSEIERFERDKSNKAENLQSVQTQLESLANNVQMLITVASLYQEVTPMKADPLSFIQTFGSLMDEKSLVKSLKWVRGQKIDNRNSGMGEEMGGMIQPDGSSTPAGGLNPSALMSSQISMEFVKHGGDRERLGEDANSFFARLGQAMADYEIVTAKLPGVVTDDEKLELNFDDPSVGDTKLKEGENVVSLTVTGPKSEMAEDPNAAAAGMPEDF